MILISIIVFNTIFSFGQSNQQSESLKYKAIMDYILKNKSLQKNIKETFNLKYRMGFSNFKIKVCYGNVQNFFMESYFKNDSSKIEFNFMISNQNLEQFSTIKKANYILHIAGCYKNYVLTEISPYKEKWYKKHSYNYEPVSWGYWHYLILFIFKENDIIDIKVTIPIIN